MALDIRGFITPEQDFSGMGKLGEAFSQQRKQKAAEGERAAAQKKANDNYLSAFLDPKEFMTATVNDPYITSRIANIMNKGMELAKTKGMDATMLYAALSPEVNRLSKDVQSIKELERQRKMGEETLKGKKGIDVAKFNERFKQRAYFNEDGTLKSDLSQVDPTYNYADEVLSNDDIYTPESIDEFVAKAGISSQMIDKNITDGKGGVRRAKLNISAPDFLVPKEKNGIFQREFEPRHELFVDNGNVVEEEILDPMTGKPVLGSNGKPVKKPVKMVTSQDFETILQNPAAAAYIKQEVRKVANQLGLQPGTSQYNMYARKIAYDALDRASKGKTQISEVQVQKEPNVINNNYISDGSGRGGGKGGASEVNIIKVYDDIKSRADENQRLNKGALTVNDAKLGKKVLIKGYVPVNSLTNTQQNAVISAVSSKGGRFKDFGPENIYIRNTADGQVGIFNVMTNELITTLDREGSEVAANKPLGVKAKQKALAEAQKSGNTLPPDKTSGKLGKGALDNIGKQK